MALKCVRFSVQKYLQHHISQDCARCLSSKSTVRNESYGDNFELRFIAEEQRPLVMLFSWMLAKQRHIERFGNFYLSRGFDVLTIKLKPQQVLLPNKTKLAMLNLSDLLAGPLNDKRDIVVHGFSVGGYVFSELLVQINSDPERYSEIRKRLAAQIFDSPVDYDGVARGFANVLTESQILRKTLNALIFLYLKTFKTNVQHYIKASVAFKTNELNLPSMILYSESDPIGCAKIIGSVLKDWRRRNDFKVYSKSWEDTPHVSHFHKHPDEYIDMLLMFLDDNKLLRDDFQSTMDDEDVKEIKTSIKR